jgi:hypothetical protein
MMVKLKWFTYFWQNFNTIFFPTADIFCKEIRAIQDKIILQIKLEEIVFTWIECVWVCTCVWMCVYMCVCTCVCVHVCVYMCVCTCVCVHVCVFESVWSHVCVCVHVRVYVCVYLSVYVCVFESACEFNRDRRKWLEESVLLVQLKCITFLQMKKIDKTDLVWENFLDRWIN